MITLDSIREAAEQKYGSYDIDLGNGKVVKLRNVMRLSADDRKKVAGMKALLEAEDADQLAIFRDVLTTLAGSKAAAKPLLDLVGDDLVLLAEIFSGYAEGTKAGEA